MLLVHLFIASLFAANTVRVVSLQQLMQITQQENNTLYVINFWATWCKPCVEEMPCFESANQKWRDQNVKVVFVSLNSVKEKAAVDKFIAKRGIETEVLLLDAGNPNNWIDQIEKEWTGSIPATLFFKNGKKVLFHEGEITGAQLDTIIQLKK